MGLSLVEEKSWANPAASLLSLLLASKSNLHMEGAVSGGASLLLVPPSCCQWLSPSLGSRVVFFPVNLYFPTSIVILMPRISWGNRWKCLL